MVSYVELGLLNTQASSLPTIFVQFLVIMTGVEH